MKKGLLIMASIVVGLTVMMIPVLVEDAEVPLTGSEGRTPGMEDSLRTISNQLQEVLRRDAARRQRLQAVPGPLDTAGLESVLRDSLRELATQIQRLSENIQTEETGENISSPSSNRGGTWKDKLSLYILILVGVLVREVYKLSDGDLSTVTIREAVDLVDIKTFGGALVLSAALFLFIPSEELTSWRVSEALMTGLAWNTVLEMIFRDTPAGAADSSS
jgi:hypothetical protein